MTALVTAGALIGAFAGTVGPAGASSVATDACGLLTRDEITTVLPEAPLDPGPRPLVLRSSRKKFTRCRFDDEKVATSPQLVAYTGLGRHLGKVQAASLGDAQPGSPGRSLTAAELAGVADRAFVEIIEDGTYGSIVLVKGDRAVLVSAAYVGPGAVPQVSEAQMISLGKIAAARL